MAPPTHSIRMWMPQAPAYPVLTTRPAWAARTLVGAVLALSRPKASMWLQLIVGVGIILTSSLTVFVVAFIMFLAGTILAWLVMRQQRQAPAQTQTGVQE